MWVSDLLGLPNFTELFSYLPSDIVNFILFTLAILLILAFRRVLY